MSARNVVLSLLRPPVFWAAKNLLLRADTAGASHWFAEECRNRNIDYTLGYGIDGRIREALVLVQEEDWEPAREADGTVRSWC